MLRAIIAGAVALCLAPSLAWPQGKPLFIPFQGASKGALYAPDSGPAPHVGIVVMHRTANYLRHPACTELSRRGFMLLCMTTRFENNEVFVDYEKLPLDVKTGVDYLRRQPGITKVLLFGHSGGGPRAFCPKEFDILLECLLFFSERLSICEGEPRLPRGND